MPTRTLSRPRHSQRTAQVLRDPSHGHVVTVPTGSQLAVRFPAGLGISRWRIADRPGHLVPINEGHHEFLFVVFGTDEPLPLRLVRYRADGEEHVEERHLYVVPQP